MSNSIRSLFSLRDNYHHYRFTGVFFRTIFVTAIPALAVPAMIYGASTPHKFPLSSVELISGAVILGMSWIIGGIFYLLES